ncbi:uncharacterized protein EV420DRAFT_1481733 [Desarmillaria tabescens]|uniref:Uncharacterized protein n=1 Tax=Armillaria tabescens TaxID=1929756 RepID=A0AA39K3P9_ARMTA|nr:uncharacterized protein EV420DRAFT_1481733 [Desarmillaria tabescens]KAK0454012.1 hypothetical protein EV420DRAFT_1481733 [Desarmillaria tabescens]
MSFETLRSLWPTLTPMFSPGAALTIPAMRRMRLLKEAAPAAMSSIFCSRPLLNTLISASRARPNIEYRGFALNLAYTLSLVAIEISKEMYDERWDELSLTPHGVPYAIRFSVNEPAPKFMPRSSQTVPTPSGSSSKGKSKTQASTYFANPSQRKAWFPSRNCKSSLKARRQGQLPCLRTRTDEDDAGNSLDEESVVVAKPFRPPASQGSPSKHTKPGPNRHSVAGASVPPSVDLPVGVVEEQVIRTRGEKRKRTAAIAAMESHVETSNVRDESPELPKKMTKQHMAQLGRQAATQVPSSLSPVNSWAGVFLVGTVKGERRWFVHSRLVLKSGTEHVSRYTHSWRGHPTVNLHRLLGTAEYLVKAFDSACETAGHLSKLLCDTCKDIDAVIRDTVEYEGRVMAKESLVTDVSAINGLLDGFSAQEVEVSTNPEDEDETGPFSLSYDASSPQRDEALRREEGGGGKMDADGDLDAEV